MADILVPRYIITQLCMPGGRRTAKKPALPQEYSVIAKRIIPCLGPTSHTQGYTPYTCARVWDSCEYRYWAMSYSAGVILAECRCCGELGSRDYLKRREHFEAQGCAKKLDKALQSLLKDGLCLICDQKTFGTKKKWGVPLCSDACQQAWCESEPQPEALKAALMLVQARGY